MDFSINLKLPFIISYYVLCTQIYVLFFQKNRLDNFCYIHANKTCKSAKEQVYNSAGITKHNPSPNSKRNGSIVCYVVVDVVVEI